MKYHFDTFTYDQDQGAVLVNDETRPLTRIQNKLLQHFIANPERIISRQSLMDAVWGRAVTENAVDQAISTLRSCIEQNPAKPNCLVTHFGQGFRFQCKVKKQDKQRKDLSAMAGRELSWPWMMALVVIAAVAVAFVEYPFSEQSAPVLTSKDELKPSDTSVLVMPMKYSSHGLQKIEKNGMTAFLENYMETPSATGLAYGKYSQTEKQSLEKNWQKTQQGLILLQSRISKQGADYTADLSLSHNGNKQQFHLSADTPAALMQKQLAFIAGLKSASSKFEAATATPDLKTTPEQNYILALGYQRAGDEDLAIKKLKELLQQQDQHIDARLTLIELLLKKKQLDAAAAQLSAVENMAMGTDRLPFKAYLLHAQIDTLQKQPEKAIHYLTEYLAGNNESSARQTAQIKQAIAANYLQLANTTEAHRFYQLALRDIDPETSPDLAAISEYGMGKSASFSGNIAQFKENYLRAYEYAVTAGDEETQIRALNRLAHLSLAQYDWEKAVSYQKRALQLAEITGDKSEMAAGLSTLVSMLNLNGQFTEAQTVNNRLRQLAEELDSSNYLLMFIHFDIVLALNRYDWNHAERQIHKEAELARAENNIGMQLNGAFLELEYLLLKKDLDSFMPAWNRHNAFLDKYGFSRFQIYMDLYLGRYQLAINAIEKARQTLGNVMTRAEGNRDYKMVVESGVQLARVELAAKKPADAMAILDKLAQFKPHPNPYLELKAEAQLALNRPVEALATMQGAKRAYNESWTAANQNLLSRIEKAVNTH